MRYPHAIWKGASSADYSAARIEPRFVVVHVAQGTASGTTAWFHDPSAQVSAHFMSPKLGPILQYVDTNQEAWAECAFNGVGISVEHEGYSGESLTLTQLANDRALFAWILKVHAIPLGWRANAYGRSGYVSHGELGVAGGDHLECPGAPIVKDVQELLASMRRRPLLTLS